MARPAKKKKTVAKAKPAKKLAAKVKKVIKKTVKASVKKPPPVLKSVKPAAKPTAKAPSKMAIGSPAPDFSMPATHLGQVTAASLKGKPYVLYFYPKDDTSGCTAEACEFRNTLPNFGRMNAAIIGVSKDSMESHQKFSRKYNLNFPLASDENNNVCESFGTWVQKSMYGRTYMGIERSTFVVDAKGIIRAMWRKVSVSGHVDEVRKAVEAL